MRPTPEQIRECLLDMMRDTPDHAWATPTLTEAFAWREADRVRLQLRRLVAPLGLVGCTDYGSPLWWWPLDVIAAASCGPCGRPATEWAYGLVEHAWVQTLPDDRAYIPGTGDWCCGAAACRADIFTRQWQTIDHRIAVSGI